MYQRGRRRVKGVVRKWWKVKKEYLRNKFGVENAKDNRDIRSIQK